MFWKRSLNCFAPLQLMIIILCAGTCAVMGQDSKATAGDDKAMWKDGATGLTWTSQDNGSSVSMSQAADYCGKLRSGGYSDWRMPTIDELEAIYDSKLSKQYKIKGSIQLSDSCILSSATNSSGEPWSFCFNYGGRTLASGTGCGSSGRALCVHGPAK
jgi:hypothetical protein